MRSHVCVCALLSFSPVLSCVHFCYKCRSCWCLRAAPLLQNIGEEKSYNVFLKLFSTIFHRYACAGVCLCVTVSAVCVWLWSVDSFAGRVQTSALLLGAAITMANYYLFFFCFGESVDRIFLSTERQRVRVGDRQRVEITLAIDAAVAAAAAAFA